MQTKITIRERSVCYDDDEKNIKYGLKYLKETLSSEEIKPFFDEAHKRGSAQFEDRDRHQFTLFYKGGSYLLISRK